MASSRALLRLLQLSSPTLPIGSYAYSQGVEAAVHAKLIVDETTALAWLRSVLRDGLVHGDLALLHHFYQAWHTEQVNDLQVLTELSHAIRETHELWQEDQHLAKALMRLAKSLNISFEQSGSEVCYPMVYAKVALAWDASAADALTAFCWSWMENQIAALIKLVPLGQTQGQSLMLQMDEAVIQAVEKAQQVKIEDIGNSLMQLAILSSRHETQYSRLFRS